MNFSAKFIFSIGLLAFVSVMLPGSLRADPFTYMSIDVPGSTFTYAFGINDSGQIVGIFEDSSKIIHSFVDNGGVFTTLDDPSATGSEGTQAAAINDSGEIVGLYEAGTAFHGFSYDGSSFTPIDVPGPGVNTFAEGVNNAGQISGFFSDTSGSAGFLDTSGSFGTYGDPKATFGTIGEGVSDTALTGFYDNATGSHGYIFDGITFTNFDAPGTTGSTFANGVNNSNQVVGYYTDGTGNHGFLYDGGAFTSLDNPDAKTGETFAQGISNNGDIVGYYVDSTTGETEGFLATPNGSTTGSTSMPEPSSALLLASGLLALLAFAARSKRQAALAVC